MEDVFKDLNAANQSRTFAVRVLCLILLILGHFLMFLPIIMILKFVPIVGYFLSMAAGLAALLFAVVWGTMLFFVTLTISWVAFNPKKGAIMALISMCLLGMMMLVHVSSDNP